mgnify:CR=1 FL=1
MSASPLQIQFCTFSLYVLTGKATMKDPITSEEIPFYPFKYKFFKYTISFVTFLVMVSYHNSERSGGI